MYFYEVLHYALERRAPERPVSGGQVGALRKSEFSFSGKFCIFLVPNVAPMERIIDKFTR